jgi:hypothetical protein
MMRPLHFRPYRLHWFRKSAPFPCQSEAWLESIMWSAGNPESPATRHQKSRIRRGFSLYRNVRLIRRGFSLYRNVRFRPIADPQIRLFLSIWVTAFDESRHAQPRSWTAKLTARNPASERPLYPRKQTFGVTQSSHWAGAKLPMGIDNERRTT